jgi:hypothetical protein
MLDMAGVKVLRPRETLQTMRLITAGFLSKDVAASLISTIL